MAIAINSGICAGSFAPTSLFGVITYRVARQAGIDVSTFILLAVAIVANLALFAVASMVFSRYGSGVSSSLQCDRPFDE